MRIDHARKFALAAILVLGASLASGASEASAGVLPRLPSKDGKHSRSLVVCKDTTFALCASATCTPTGGFITGNDGIRHPAAVCECPILVGNNIADLKGGNVDGSCEAPEGFVYSTYEINGEYPQLIDGTWQTAPAEPQVCPAKYSFAQCWNWKCTVGDVVDGVQLAECTCPIEKTPFEFVTQAGQGDPSYCEELPVGGPLFFDPAAFQGR
jgi:hypothetical protein